jgi:hypothetical protein
MVGIGEIEPIEDLAEEMNTLRSQRRDAATMALNAPYAYYDGLVDPADLKWGPNVAIPVPGDPRELLFQLPVKDVPASGYQEAAEIKADIEQASVWVMLRGARMTVGCSRPPRAPSWCWRRRISGSS